METGVAKHLHIMRIVLAFSSAALVWPIFHLLDSLEPSIQTYANYVLIGGVFGI
jgi:hypothetical protein